MWVFKGAFSLSRVAGDGTFTFEEFVQVMANMGGISSEQSEEDEEEELRQAFTVRSFETTCLFIGSLSGLFQI